MPDEMVDFPNGVEAYEAGPGQTKYACARCGSSVEWLDCPNCVDGYSHHDCGEDCCCCVNPEDNVLCDWCRGTSGSWHCVSTPEYCETNPIPGREHVRSTALNAEAWRDL